MSAKWLLNLLIYEQGLWDGTFGLQFLFEKTLKSNRLMMMSQRQHFFLSYLESDVQPAELTAISQLARQWISAIYKFLENLMSRSFYVVQ